MFRYVSITCYVPDAITDAWMTSMNMGLSFTELTVSLCGIK